MKRSPKEKLIARHRRIRARVQGIKERPRLSVSRSNQFMQAQIIDDAAGVTVVSSTDRTGAFKGTKLERAAAVGKDIAEKAKAKGITKVVFDRGGFRYHGRVRSLADAARSAGLEF